MIDIRRLLRLPADLDSLAATADAESMGMVSRLATEYRNGQNRFDGPGEGLWEARHRDRLIAICGLNVDPFASTDERCGRVRRLYVLPEWRRRGVATELLNTLTAHATTHFARLTAFTNEVEVVSFYLARGFRPVDGVNRRSVERDLP